MPRGKEESNFKVRRNTRTFCTKKAGEGSSNCLFVICSSQAVLTRAAGEAGAEVEFVFPLLRGESLCPILAVCCRHGRCPCRRRSVAVAGPAEVREWLRLGGTSGGHLLQTCPLSRCAAPRQLAAQPAQWWLQQLIAFSYCQA